MSGVNERGVMQFLRGMLAIAMLGSCTSASVGSAEVQIAYDLSESRVLAFDGWLELMPAEQGRLGPLAEATAQITLSGLPAYPLDGPALVEAFNLGRLPMDEDILGLLRIQGEASARQIGRAQGTLRDGRHMTLDAAAPLVLSIQGMITCAPVELCAPLAAFPLSLRGDHDFTPLGFDLHDLEQNGKSWISGRIELAVEGQTAILEIMGREQSRTPVPEPRGAVVWSAGLLGLVRLRVARRRVSRRRATRLLLLLALPLAFVACEVKSKTIPLHVIALADDDGGRPTTVAPADFATRVDFMNTLYAPAAIQFSFDPNTDWETLNDTALNELWNGDSEFWVAPNAIAARYPGKIVVFLRYGHEEEPAQGAFAYPPDTGAPIPSGMPLPTEDVEFVAYPNQSEVLPDSSNGFLAHEVGHYLGLYHTHPAWGDDEDAIQALLHSGGIDALDGDGLDDTAPDGARSHFLTNTGFDDRCSGSTSTYAAPSDFYTYFAVLVSPDRDNVMSYFRCGKARFSALQIEILHDTLEHESRRHLVEPVCAPDHHRLPTEDFQRCVDYWAHKGRWPVSVSAAEFGAETGAPAVYMTSTIQPGAPRIVRDLATPANYQETFDEAADQGYRPEQVQGVVVEGETRYNGVWTATDDEFVSFHSLSEEEFATVFADSLEAGHDLVDFNVHDVGEADEESGEVGPRFAATWVDRSHKGYIAEYDMTAAEYEQLFQQYDDQDFRVVRFSSYATPSGIRHAALWHPKTTPYVHHPYQAPSEHQANYDALRFQGFKLLQLHDYNGLISAIWVQ